MKDEHAKDAAQDVAQDVTLDVAEDILGAVEGGSVDVLGAVEDGGVEVFIVAHVIFQWRDPRPTHACRPPRFPWAISER